METASLKSANAAQYPVATYTFAVPRRYRLVHAIFPTVSLGLGIVLRLDSSDITVLDFGTNDGNGSWLVEWVFAPIFMVLGLAWLLIIGWKAAVGTSGVLYADRLEVKAGMLHKQILYSEVHEVIFQPEPTNRIAGLLHPPPLWTFSLRERPSQVLQRLTSKEIVGGGFGAGGLGFAGPETSGATAEEVLQFLQSKGLSIRTIASPKEVALR